MSNVNNMQNEIHSAVADATRTGADIITNVNDHQGWNKDYGGFKQKIESFENRIIQNGTETMGDITDKGKIVVENLEDLGETMEEKIKDGAEELMESGKDALEDVTHGVEENVSDISEAINNKVEEVMNKVEEAVGDVTGHGKKDKVDDVDQKIDDLLENFEKS